ncbi:carbohydrate porin [Desulfopila sp. IMCC35008]|uniref:carbohydrate porin n=1 Tax=Desulfopila sp. IMCC35008 TaxID=2653858 RepID=UPI0013D67442|nr:carbohydrate porin [Desulfopila sp. IMCC35008]
MLKTVIWLLVSVFAVGSVDVQISIAEETAQVEKNESSGKIALSEVAPELYFQLRRYQKFYGDPNMINGDLSERSFLFDDLGGIRDTLTDHGIYLDMSVTQFLQGNMSGGEDNGDARYNGTADYWLTLDTGKAGLWSGGAVFLHAESSWQADKSINSDTGNLLPPNFDATMPTPGENEGLVLPELYLVQALPADFLVLAGKVNWAGLADNNLFANNEHTQFLSTGLVNNPILGAFVPYTSLGLGGVWTPSKKHTVALIGIQSDGNGTTTGFDNFNGEYTLGLQYQFSPTLGENLPGNYRIIAGYSNKEILKFDICPRQLIGSITGEVPVANESENYTLLLNFDQYLWVKDGNPDTGRKGLPPVGFGIFGRAGWAPADRNVIDQFYSFGVGGYGMLIPGRDSDQWGIGWSGTHISSDMRGSLDFLSIEVDSFEHAAEAFYNFEVTPAIHLSVNAQVIDSTVPSVDTAYALGTRLQIDF